MASADIVQSTNSQPAMLAGLERDASDLSDADTRALAFVGFDETTLLGVGE